jgi:hypothetical protein
MLFAAIGTVAILVVGGFMFRESDVMLGALAVYASMLAVSMQGKTYYRLQGAEVTPTQFPEIYEVVEELRQRFRAPQTHVFGVRKQVFRTEASGLTPPYVIVLPSVVIDALDRDELRYVLGQALGNVCFGHTRVAVLLGGEESALPAVLSWVAWVRDLIFSGYWRAGQEADQRSLAHSCCLDPMANPCASLSAPCAGDDRLGAL